MKNYISTTSTGIVFTDSKSNFSSSMATSGSVIYCSYCTLSFTDSIIENVYANNGGAFYLTSANLTLTRVSVNGVSIIYYGGVIYSESS